MRRLAPAMLVAIGSGGPDLLHAQEEFKVSEHVRIPETAVFDIRSEHADADFQLWVAEPIPGVIPFPSEPRQVLYVLDANLFFGTAVEMTRLMSQLYGELPPLLVVGIAYDTASPTVQAELRARDFTPTVDAGFSQMARSLPGAPPPTLPEDRRLGRANEFLAFLTEEVQPFVERRYDVAEEGSVLFGSSLGGLFALYAMLKRTAAFDSYVAVSPAIWWDDSLLLRQAADVAASGEDLTARVFLAVGSEEERADVPMLAQYKMVSNLTAFADELGSRDQPSLDLEAWVAEGESHTSVVPAALTRGLRYVMGPGRRPGV